MFHNTANRYRLFRETLAADSKGRAVDVQPEIDFALARETEVSTLVDQQAAGIPVQGLAGLLPLQLQGDGASLLRMGRMASQIPAWQR